MKKIFFVSHTHFDAEVFKTREEYLEQGFLNILEALHLLKKYPEFRFTLDQVCYLEPFMERYPSCRELMLRFIQEKRLCIVGGMYSMPDMNMPSGESLARQFLRGITYCREVLGADVTVGWTIDSFGHPPQTPQMMAQAGLKYHAFFRAADFTPSDFIWAAPDGSETICHHMYLTYSGFDMPGTQEKFDDEVFHRVNVLETCAATDNIMLPCGGDLSAPNPRLMAYVKGFNEKYTDYQIVIATPLDYFEALEAHKNILIRRQADLNPVFQGCYSSRIEVKQGNRRLENAFFTAEVLTACSGSTYSSSVWQDAWDKVLFNQFHDDICGTVVDKVFKLMMDRYAASEEKVKELSSAALDTLSGLVDTRGEGIPVLVFNSLGWARKEPVKAQFTVLEPDGIKEFEIRDSAGNVLPSQMYWSERYSDGGFKEVFIQFIADLPPMGYEVFYAVPLASVHIQARVPAKYRIAELNEVTMGNEFLDIKFDFFTGVINSLKLKSSGHEIIDTKRPWGAMITVEPDNGDFWELNAPLRGAMSIPLNRSRKIMEIPGARYTKDAGGNCRYSMNDVRSTFSVKQNIGKNNISYDIILYNGINRLEVKGSIINTEEDVLYRAAIPLNIDSSAIRGIPFGFCDTPEGEYPAVDFMDISDDQKGVTVVNTGNAGNCYLDKIFTLSLLKATSYKRYNNSGFTNIAPADGGFEIGKTIPFHYALVPHDGKCAPAESAKAAREFNVLPAVWKCGVHDGSLPKRFSFLSTDCPTVLITCFRPCEGGYILRLYEAGGIAYEQVNIKINIKFSHAAEVDFTETPVSEGNVTVDAGELVFPLRANEIKTIRLFTK